eukprot:jgi/Mesvir1/20489/Mv12376-RA.1
MNLVLVVDSGAAPWHGGKDLHISSRAEHSPCPTICQAPRNLLARAQVVGSPSCSCRRSSNPLQLYTPVYSSTMAAITSISANVKSQALVSSFSGSRVVIPRQPARVEQKRSLKVQALIKHMVLFKMKKDVPLAEINDFMSTMSRYPTHFPGMLDFSGGIYKSPEGFNDGYTHGFLMTFVDEASRDEYCLRDPGHKKQVERVLKMIEPEHGVVSFDWIEEPNIKLHLDTTGSQTHFGTPARGAPAAAPKPAAPPAASWPTAPATGGYLGSSGVWID